MRITVEENLADLLLDASRYCIVLFPHFPPILREGNILTKEGEKNPVLTVVIIFPRVPLGKAEEGKKEGHSFEIKGAAMHLSFFAIPSRFRSSEC